MFCPEAVPSGPPPRGFILSAAGARRAKSIAHRGRFRFTGAMRSVENKRAVAAGTAVVLVGLHLSIIMGIYFLPTAGPRDLLGTRWFWDFSLYLQAFCICLMFPFHTERIGALEGWRKGRAAWRFLAALVGVSAPIFVIMTAAFNDWLTVPPPREAMILFGNTLFIVWVAIDYALPLFLRWLAGDRAPTANRYSRTAEILILSPLIVLVAVMAGNLMLGGELYLVVWPFLLYLHRGVSYFLVAFKPRPQAPTVQPEKA
ncbi:hypothetical protein SAMN04488071_2536 [Kordiimonas lacus]|uniref:Uncharacterized protein n=1 Tax=Kordiimonas lacus TaxID=637679 RepID=A0A1G7BIQ5_9PROT|nr:hypothetical protein SAMN04488071_2536 [Kordiimonas lacus]